MIWLPHCHPATNNWKYEGCPDSRITEELISDIRNDFASQALTAGTWRLIDRLGLMERAQLAACLRSAYRILFKPWKQLREQSTRHAPKPGRLVDKSVHAALWLNLVDAVFPDAIYIHMVRSPETCVPSMVHGWQAPKRFQTYLVPASIAPARPDTLGHWCFPMPPHWVEHYHNDLIDICCFQWNTIHSAILHHLADHSYAHRAIRVHLEVLVTQPESVLQGVAELLSLNVLRYHQGDSPLPMVNVFHNKQPVSGATVQRIIDNTGSIYETLRT